MSDTLVIHPEDESTKMLSNVYEGKGFDVISDPNIPRLELYNQIATHKRIIMLGHGTGDGLCHPELIKYGRLLTPNARPFLIDDSFADLLRTKETISVWCFSDMFFLRNDIGGFHTGMIISEVKEANYFLGHSPLSEEELYQNMIVFSLAVRDAIELPLSQMQDCVLEKYSFDDEITQYNRKNIKVL